MSTIKANTIQPLSDSASVVVRTNAQDSLTVDSSGNITVRNEAVIDGINIGLGSAGIASNLRIGASTFASTHTTSANNIAIGVSSQNALVGGLRNVAMGNNSLNLLTNANDNTAIGYDTGKTITTGSGNILIGSGADTSSGTIANSIAIGHNASAATSNSVYLGNSSTTSLYMGNGSAVAPVYLPRAWVNFNGIASAYETVSASYLGPGTYRVRVTQSNHGHQVGHKLFVLNPSWAGGENGDTYITSVIDQNTFEYWTAQAGNAAASGTVTLRKCAMRGNGNVHSVYQATPMTFPNVNAGGFGGYYFINLITPLPDANYCILGMSSLAGYQDANCANNTVERCSPANTFFGRTNNSAAIVVVNNNSDDSYNSFSTNIVFIR